jgi:hypothetical protein
VGSHVKMFEHCNTGCKDVNVHLVAAHQGSPVLAIQLEVKARWLDDLLIERVILLPAPVLLHCLECAFAVVVLDNGDVVPQAKA